MEPTNIIATGMTFDNPDAEIPAEQVKGVLSKRYVEAFDYWQFLIDGKPVQEDTIEVDPTEQEGWDED